MTDDELDPCVICGYLATYEAKITFEISKPKEYGAVAYVDKVKGSPLCEDCKRIYMNRIMSIMAELHKEDSLEEDFQQKLDHTPSKEKEVAAG
ncbi:MAG: hypothetical protein KO464_05645 [Candidatus Methanofastidiosum sp.]|nr:hypothetical protein [Methanofastidiosum sp.]